MNLKLFILIHFIFFAIGGFCQGIDYQPNSLLKDMQKIWQQDDIAMYEVEIPDSMYNDFLLDRGKIYKVFSKKSNVGFAYIGRIYSCRAGGCGLEDIQVPVSIDEDFEFFDYYILFGTNLEVQKVRVYNYQATHGHEVGGRGWLKQFIGYKGEKKLELGKNIDAISGATISANAITYNVQESSRYLSLLLTATHGVEQGLKSMIIK